MFPVWETQTQNKHDYQENSWKVASGLFTIVQSGQGSWCPECIGGGCCV